MRLTFLSLHKSTLVKSPLDPSAPGARLETIPFGRVPPDGVASNSVSATARELVTTTTTDGVTFLLGVLCRFPIGATGGGALAARALAAGLALLSERRPPRSLTPRRQPTQQRRMIFRENCSCYFLPRAPTTRRRTASAIRQGCPPSQGGRPRSNADELNNYKGPSRPSHSN
jgi:hypothetical protein